MSLNQRGMFYAEGMTQDLRPIDAKRIAQAGELGATPPAIDDTWFIHTVLAQCFLPYRDPKTDHWNRTNGDYSIAVSAGQIQDPATGKLRWQACPLEQNPDYFRAMFAPRPSSKNRLSSQLNSQ